MRKKAILLLLFLPFVIAIFAFVTSTFVIRSVEGDIEDIKWDYTTGENPFSLSQKRALLKAEAVYDTNYPLSEGNELVWKCVSDKGEEESDVAHIEVEEDGTYLAFEKEGTCKVICSNEKGNVQKSFLARIVGDSGAIILNPVLPFSATSITGKHYVGLYDSKKAYEEGRPDSSYLFDLQIFGTDSFREEEIQVESTDNVEVDLKNHKVKLLEEGEAFVTFRNPVSSKGDGKLSLDVVSALNVYDYDDLMEATNNSEKGIPVVLRRNLLSLDKAYEKDKDGNLVRTKEENELFGRLSQGENKIAREDLYLFETTYDHSYLDLWNTNNPDSPVSLMRYAAVHIQKDFYGNGFEINLHDLAYPSEEQTITDSLGNKTTNALLGPEDLYRGPLVLQSLGDPNTKGVSVTSSGLPIFALYGQDNVGFYVEGEDIDLIDCHFSNCDNFANNLTNLTYVGTVLEAKGERITIKDSILEKGRNVVRAFSTKDLTIDNSLLQNAMEFLFLSGANESNKVDLKKKVLYTDRDKVRHETTAEDYLASESLEGLMKMDSKADSLLSFGAISNTQASEFVGIDGAGYEKEDYIQGLDPIRESLTNTEGFFDKGGNKVFFGNATIKDCSFDNSGISAIGLDTLPQGSFLESNITSLLSLITGIYFGNTLPSHMARTSAPVLVQLEGDCRFYDWKKVDNLSFESLILENIANLIRAHGGLGDDWKVEITEDDYLPLRLLLKKEQSRWIHDEEINLPVFYRGGGYNASEVRLSDNLKSLFGEEFSLDPYVYSLDLSQEPVADFNASAKAKYEAMKIAMLRAASNVTGFYPYRFQSLSGVQFQKESPNILDFQNRA